MIFQTRERKRREKAEVKGIGNKQCLNNIINAFSTWDTGGKKFNTNNKNKRNKNELRKKPVKFGAEAKVRIPKQDMVSNVTVCVACNNVGWRRRFWVMDGCDWNDDVSSGFLREKSERDIRIPRAFGRTWEECALIFFLNLEEKKWLVFILLFLLSGQRVLFSRRRFKRKTTPLKMFLSVLSLQTCF